MSTTQQHTVELRPHQREGVEWLVARERSPAYKGCSGGLLCDGTGLGKTVQLLELILRHGHQADRSAGDGRRHGWLADCTVVVVTKMLVQNWRREIAKHYGTSGPACHVVMSSDTTAPPARRSGPTVLLITYDQVREAYKEVRTMIDDACRAHVASLGHARTDVRYDIAYKRCFTEAMTMWHTDGCMSGDRYSTVVPTKLRQVLMLSGGIHRLVVDEAHQIRNDSTEIFSALSHMPARHRWYVSASPVHNTLDDLMSALAFLRIDTSALEQLKRDQKAYQAEIKAIMSNIMLRREKDEVMRTDEYMRLAPVDRIEVFHDFVTTHERRLHDALYSMCRLKSTARSGDASQQAAAADQKKKPAAKKRRTSRNKHSMDAKTRQQVIGYLTHARMACYSAVEMARSHVNDTAGSKAPTELVSLCRSYLAEMERCAGGGGAVVMETKHLMLRALLEHHVPPDERVIVFTHWVKGLDAYAATVRLAGRPCFRLVGDMKEEERWSVLDMFSTSEGGCLLASIEIVSIGLTLVEANWAIFLDPHYNPQILIQALDRMNRLGQTKTVHMVMLLISHSVDCDIENLQLRKLRAAEEMMARGDVTDVARACGSPSDMDLLMEIMTMYDGDDAEGSGDDDK